MSYSTLYSLVDCNHFYVSCERVFKPELEKKPVAVLSNNDGCIVALSPELKKLGVKRGTPWFKIKHLIKRHDIRVFSSNYTLYADMSFRVMSVLGRFTPELEVYSIDEAFLNFSGLAEKDFTEYGKTIRKTVRKWTGIPVSIGIAPTKTLAKAANRVAKKDPQNDGVFLIDNEATRHELLKKTGVGDIWGIGSRYAAKLKKYGIENAWQLSQADNNWILKNMTVVELRMVEELRGNPYIEKEIKHANTKKYQIKENKADYNDNRETELSKCNYVAAGQSSSNYSRTQRSHASSKWSDLYLPNSDKPRKNIVSSRSFGRAVESYKELSEALSSYCVTALHKLRQQGSVAKRITIFLTTNPFKNEPQYANYREAVLPGYSAYPPDFIHIAQKMLKTIYRKGFRYKKIGVMIADIIQQEETPQDLFETAYPYDYRSDVMNCVDNINSRWGEGTISFASEGVRKEWSMKRKMLSQKYTTSFKELPVVKA